MKKREPEITDIEKVWVRKEKGKKKKEMLT